MRVTPAASNPTTARPTATAMRRVRRRRRSSSLRAGGDGPGPSPGCPGSGAPGAQVAPTTEAERRGETRSRGSVGTPGPAGRAPEADTQVEAVSPGVRAPGHPRAGVEEGSPPRTSTGPLPGTANHRRDPHWCLPARGQTTPRLPGLPGRVRCQPAGGGAAGARATTRRDEAWTRSTPSCSKGRRSSVARDKNWMRACWLQSRHARDSGGSDG